MDMDIQISPRVLCACGKSILRMTEDQRRAYDDHVRIIERGREEKRSESHTVEAVSPDAVGADED